MAIEKLVPRVTLLQSSFLSPSTPTPLPPPSIPLSRFDLLLQDIQYNQRILLYSTNAPAHFETFSSLVDKLQTSLSQALVHFYPLAGRFHLSPAGRLHVLCNDAGAEFIVASANVTLAEMMDCRKAPIFFELARRKDALTVDGFHLPLLIVQVTQLGQDGIALGLTLNHSLVDGNSTWHFINSWAEICRGKDSISLTPIYDRSLIEESFDEIPAFDEQVERVPLRSPKLLKETVFHFSAEAVAELKEEANRNRAKGSRPISSYQALSVHLWKCITRARELGPEETTWHKFSVDCRRRLVPPVPAAYFGNVINSIAIRATVKELLDESKLWEMASKLQKAIEAYDNEAIRRGARETRSVSVGGMENTVHVGSSFRFAAYESDFGWGRPEGVRSGDCSKCDGKITYFPGRDGGGSVDAEITMNEDCMEKLEDLLLMKK